MKLCIYNQFSIESGWASPWSFPRDLRVAPGVGQTTVPATLLASEAHGPLQKPPEVPATNPKRSALTCYCSRQSLNCTQDPEVHLSR